VLAFAITWVLDIPLVLACLERTQPSETALMMAGFGSLGPTLAAFLVALRRRQLGDVFGRWRTNPIWIPIALFLPLAAHLIATLIEVALGGTPSQWFYPPVRPEHVAALVMFSLGEEFGWRGYAHPRITERWGMLIGSLLLGSLWGLWHLGMMFTPEGGAPALEKVLLGTAELALWSVVIAWIFERSNRSMFVAIAIHAGGHLDNVNRAPESEVRLRILRFAVLVIAAAIAGYCLMRKKE